jgi:FkbM family methyltransferase
MGEKIIKRTVVPLLKKQTRLLQQLTKKVFNLMGVDIIRLPKSPRYSLLGLRHLPIRSIIDVEANTGQFAREIITVFPQAHIYCFEPLTEPYEELRKWAEKQDGRVTVFNVALGDKVGNVEMLKHLEHSPSSSFLKTTDLCHSLFPHTQRQSSVLTRMTTLDEWLKTLPNSLTPEILIKLDVQGYEDRVIRGGRETFNLTRACILEVNLDKLYEGQAEFNEIIELLYALGLEYAGNLDQIYADDGHVIYFDAVFVKRK